MTCCALDIANVAVMAQSKPQLFQSSPKGLARFAAMIVMILGGCSWCVAQDTPLLSGGVGFQTNTNGGNTTYTPIIEPLLAAPIGNHLLIESRAALLESFSPNTNGQSGYSHSHFIGLTYLEGDYIATPHITVVGGSYLLPFGTYNERLSPIWISNFRDTGWPATKGIVRRSIWRLWRGWGRLRCTGRATTPWRNNCCLLTIRKRALSR